MIATLLLALGATTCPGLPNSTGVPARLTVSMTEAGDAIDLLTEDMQPGNRALTFYGTLAMDPVPWGQGELCLHPLYMVRGPTEIADATGRTLRTIAAPLTPGTVYFQTLYRDFNGRTFNLSNMDALEVSPVTGALALQMGVWLDNWECETDETEATPICNSASELPCNSILDFDAGDWIEATYYPGDAAFDYFTQGGNDVAMEYRHHRQWDWYTFIQNCSPVYLNTCWEQPPNDQIQVSIEFKQGVFWHEEPVEFWDGTQWTTTLDQYAAQIEFAPWTAARFDSKTRCTEVRVHVKAWTGHDSYGFGFTEGACQSSGTGTLSVNWWRRVHYLTIRSGP